MNEYGSWLGVETESGGRADSAVAGSSAGSSQRDERARKERSIRELAVKFIVDR